jgi:hypothetical protein
MAIVMTLPDRLLMYFYLQLQVTKGISLFYIQLQVTKGISLLSFAVSSQHLLHSILLLVMLAFETKKFVGVAVSVMET